MIRCRLWIAWGKKYMLAGKNRPAFFVDLLYLVKQPCFNHVGSTWVVVEKTAVFGGHFGLKIKAN